MYFVISAKVCTMMSEMSSEQSRSQLYIIYICLQSAAAAAALCVALLLLWLLAAAAMLFPTAVRHRVPDGQIWCWFIEYDLSVFFLFIQTRFFFYPPPGSTVSPLVSIGLHPR